MKTEKNARTASVEKKARQLGGNQRCARVLQRRIEERQGERVCMTNATPPVTPAVFKL
ncbi:21245_t:CDS:2 [Racocetra persica]|uniref:21245_t:CDS:1 n=1 Tax=Racocetra persica TaxID=160502 RepID=A0ACA9LFT5_9GLOM|nr:21245_t:CDS:2 [Racocetra persica]